MTESGLSGHNGCGKVYADKDDRWERWSRMPEAVEIGQTVKLGYFSQENESHG